MLNNDIINEFKEMFEINVQERDETNINNEDFDKLAEDVSDEILNFDKKGEHIEKKTPKDIIEEVCIANKETEEINIFEENENKKEEKIISNEIDKNSDSVEKNILDTKEEKNNNIYTEIDETGWLLKSPSRLYDIFYEKKKEAIYRYSNGEQLDFEKYINELIHCSVDISSEVFDPDLVQKQMAAVQQFRERVKVIQIKCNNQYFFWKRSVESLRGCLARVQYEKPIIKQDGLIHEHMRDIEWYFCQLESLHNSSNQVMKTLDGAYDCLSRKVSISMELKPIERYQRTDREGKDNYDTLPNNASAQIKKKEVGIIGWEDIH